MASLKTLFLSISLLIMQTAMAQVRSPQGDSSERFFERKTQTISSMTREWQIYADSALLIDPTNDHMWQIKGVPYLKSGDYETAFRCYDKAVALNPQRWLSYRAFCKAIFLKDYQAALTDFEKADRDPHTPKYEMDHTFHFYKGLCYLGMKDFNQARLSFEKSMLQRRKDSGEDGVHYLELFYLGVSWYRLGDYTQALTYLKQCETRYAQLPDLLYYMAAIYLEQKNTFLTMDYIKRAQTAMEQGYRITEDNIYYANYPELIAKEELDELFEKANQRPKR